MPNATHISKWLQRAEPDFYSMFINAWIPFNAWYVKEYNDRHDRTCLNQIYTKPNKVKNKIKSYLGGDNSESILFRSYVTQLQLELLKHPIPDDAPINMGTVLVIDNPKNTAQDKDASYKYKWDYYKGSTPRCKCIVTRKNKQNSTYVTIDLAEWNEAELTANDVYVGIGDRRVQDKIREVFQLIRPRITRQTIVPPKDSGRTPKGVFVMDKEEHLYFVNDKELICQAIIEMLYQLRCMIFHGNIDPTTACGSIYEYAFHIQRMIIKELV